MSYIWILEKERGYPALAKVRVIRKTAKTYFLEPQQEPVPGFFPLSCVPAYVRQWDSRIYPTVWAAKIVAIQMLKGLVKDLERSLKHDYVF